MLTINALVSLLKRGLEETLTHFPPLAGRLLTDADGFVHIACNDAGVHFVHANAGDLAIRDVLAPSEDVPDSVKLFFAFDGAVSYDGHFRPIAAVQVTELADGVFVGCTVNHAVTDGTSFWNFFNTWAEVCRAGAGGGSRRISRPPNFSRNYVKDSAAVLEFEEGGPKVSFDARAPIRERIFHFSREAVRELKARANGRTLVIPIAEIIGKQSNDELKIKKGDNKGKMVIASALDALLRETAAAAAAAADGVSLEISSFQALSAQLWRSVTRARKLHQGKETTFRMAVNCRHRVEPRMDPYYFGNAIQSIRTATTAGELLSRDLGWCAGLLRRNVAAHDDATIRRGVEAWEAEPRVFPLGNPDGASITMGSSPRFPMYDNDFGWGRPVAVRSGRANKFDGKISAFPGREGGGSVDLEVCLAPETMAALETDTEFMQKSLAASGTRRLGVRGATRNCLGGDGRLFVRTVRVAMEGESEGVYHEKQRLQFCLLHALNNLLQDKDSFTRADLDGIANQLHLIDPNQVNWNPLSRVFKPHHNTLTGNYDVNVLICALEGKGKKVVWHDRRNRASSIDLDQPEETFLGIMLNVPVRRFGGLWRSRHWVALRKIAGFWHNLDSDLGTPKHFASVEEVKEFLDDVASQGGEILLRSYCIFQLMDFMKKVKRNSSNSFIGFILILVTAMSIVILTVSVTKLPDTTLERGNFGFPRALKYGKWLKEEEKLGRLGSMMVAMLPVDLAFTIFVPSEKAFESELQLRASTSLMEHEANNTSAILSRVLSFSAVPQHLPSTMVPFGGEILLDSISGLRLFASRRADSVLVVNGVSAEHVDIKKGEAIVHIMNGVIMDAEFEQAFEPEEED
ncbi:hypothetical protein H6P81_006796 [Aristolochia fimbriata]|uniref:ubiquitinyl hydrolase 1 n=1 Tax=Aristolochia fimbriata TaxID=158543 RepID=A0AAV7EYJ2_ARIFI|nr:hypothetical protein H6P81_006796 [Aristolochia fimbriata]